MQPADYKNTVRGITKTYGTGYYRATLLFPKTLKEATWTLYAFVRLPDEMIDTETDKTVSAQQLAQWAEQWRRVYQGESVPGVNEILLETKRVFDQYHIPFEYSEAFLAAMAQDLTQSRYATYEDLRTYMYGSAAAVGLMMSYVIGFDDGALPHAVALGEAMQMTNFLRDIREDYDERGRIYLPQEDMARFGITEEDIKSHTVSEKWKELMRFEIARTRALFTEGNAGIPLLHKEGRRAVLAASRVYEAILDEIEKQDYDVFTRRATVSPLKKTLLILQTLWKRNQS